MFSKPLFKQSCKANGTMWLIITVAVCFMLSSVMLIAGDENLSKTKVGIEDTIIKGELASAVQKSALNYYGISVGALQRFDEKYKEGLPQAIEPILRGEIRKNAVDYYGISAGALACFDGAFKAEFTKASESDEAEAAYAGAYRAALASGKTEEEATSAGKLALAGAVFPVAYQASAAKLQEYAASAIQQAGVAADSTEAQAIQGAIFVVFNPLDETDETHERRQFDDFYKALGEEPPRYDVQSLPTASDEERAAYRQNYAAANVPVFLAGSMADDKAVAAAVEKLAPLGLTAEQYAKMGFADYKTLKDIASGAIAEYAEYLKKGESAVDAKQHFAPVAPEEAVKPVYQEAAESLREYAASLIAERGYAEDSDEAKEIQGAVFGTFNPPVSETKYKFDDFYKALGEEPPRYDVQSLPTASDEARAAYRERYATDNSAAFLAGNMVSEAGIEKTLRGFGTQQQMTRERYETYGYTDYEAVKEMAYSAISTFRADYAYRLKHIAQDEKPESIKEELTDKITVSLLNNLPGEVSASIREIGNMDLYGTLIGSVFFKMAGLLLPIIYLIMTSNALIAGQVDSGSMAYVLSSSVKRRSVTITQALYLVGSIFAMFCLTLCTSMVCFSQISVETSLTYGKLAVINLGAFLVMFAMSGICFLTSCFFNRSKFSMSVGGGINMFFLVATMLGLFGSSVMPSVVRMGTLNMFNYVSIISLFDVVSILDGGLGYIWKLGILFVIGVVCYAVGTEKFVSKDLPL